MYKALVSAFPTAIWQRFLLQAKGEKNNLQIIIDAIIYVANIVGVFIVICVDIVQTNKLLNVFNESVLDTNWQERREAKLPALRVVSTLLHSNLLHYYFDVLLLLFYYSIIIIILLFIFQCK